MSLRSDALIAIESGINSAWPLDKFKPTEAEAALDALLVYLTDNAAEWSASTVGVNPSVAAVGYLLAALREETG